MSSYRGQLTRTLWSLARQWMNLNGQRREGPAYGSLAFSATRLEYVVPSTLQKLKLMFYFCHEESLMRLNSFCRHWIDDNITRNFQSPSDTRAQPKLGVLGKRLDDAASISQPIQRRSAEDARGVECIWSRHTDRSCHDPKASTKYTRVYA
jgi:hypothetical protein